VTDLCQWLGCSRSSYYRQPATVDEIVGLTAMENILLRFPFYGYRKLHKELARPNIVVGEHRVRRWLRQLELSRSVGQVRVQTTDSHHSHGRYPNRIKGLKITRPDQVWVADITYIRLGRRFLYLAVILDAYTRVVRGWALSRSIDQRLTLDALDKALAKATPFIFHSDQGSQYAAWSHTERLLSEGVRISMSDKASPTQNGLVERFMRTVKEEHVDYSEYRDFEDAYRQLQHWLEVTYMTERIHEALDYVTPAEFEAVALATPYPLLNPA
jgi:putative transposase